MGNECWTNKTEVKINDEDIYVSWKFRSCYGLCSRAKDRSHDNDPDSHDDNLDKECRNCPLKESVFRDPPELEKPGMNRAREYEGGA